MSEMEANQNQKVSCVANYTYEASEPDELSIKPGDVLKDVERLSGGWWRGELRGRRGMFPDNFVSLLTDSNNTKVGGVSGRCRAVFSYQPANPDELPLSVGDVLDVLGEVEEGWWQGRRQGRVGVFPSNFVVMLEPPHAPSPFEQAPALPPKPGKPKQKRKYDEGRKPKPKLKRNYDERSEHNVYRYDSRSPLHLDPVDPKPVNELKHNDDGVKEQCRVLFPYTAVNEDELTLAEGDIVTIVSKDAPDRGWWRGELNGRVGLFPDNFVQLIHNTLASISEEKPDRPPQKSPSIYPILNKYTEKATNVKETVIEQISNKIGSVKETSLNKELTTHSTRTSTSEADKFIHNELFVEAIAEGQVKKPPVPLKKSPTPGSGAVGSLFTGLKNKMISTEKEKPSSTVSSSSSSTSVEWDRPDGVAASKNNTFDHIERTTLLSDPRAGRVKAPRRRPPSQALRDDTPQLIGLSNGHEEKTDKLEKPEKTAAEKATEEIKPRTREWEKHKAPWMEELKLNQAKKTGLDKTRAAGSTDRILECGLEEKTRTTSMEMSKSTSSITNRTSVLEYLDTFEETKTRHSLESKKETVHTSKEQEAQTTENLLNSPTAAGRTLVSMLEEVKKLPAPSPPHASARAEINLDKSPKSDKSITTDMEVKVLGNVFDKTTTLERTKIEDKRDGKSERMSTLERERRGLSVGKFEGNDALIAQLNHRISNLEKLLEVQNSMFKSAIEELNIKLKYEAEKRHSLEAELEKLAHCITQV